jgi:hypothetical protein
MRINVLRLLNLLAVPILFLFACPNIGNSENVHPERYYQLIWCDDRDGRVEVALSDKTRCDCVTSTHAVEIEFDYRWHSSIGQALWYGLRTDKKAGVVLIVTSVENLKYWIKLNDLAFKYSLPIDLWLLKAF